MSSNSIRNAVMAAMAALALTAMGAKDKAKEIDAGMFFTPAAGVLNLDVGTLEVRFSLDYSFSDYLRPESSQCTPFSFLRTFNYNDKTGVLLPNREKEPVVGIATAQWRGTHAIVFSNNRHFKWVHQPPEKAGHVSIPGTREKGAFLSKGEWHALAVTWRSETNGLRVEMFLDGKSWSKYTFPDTDSEVRAVGEGDLIGIGGLELSPATVQSYRLSNRVRTPEEMAPDKPLKSDEATTFFLDGESAAKFRKLDRKDVSRIGGAFRSLGKATKGVFVGNYQVVSTPSGKAIQFYKKLSR